MQRAKRSSSRHSVVDLACGETCQVAKTPYEIQTHRSHAWLVAELFDINARGELLRAEVANELRRFSGNFPYSNRQ
jgi:hypothetical protein